MIVEVDAAILHQAEGRYALFGQRLDIGFRTVAAQLNQVCPKNLENLLHGLQLRGGLRDNLGPESRGMRGSEVAFNRGHMIVDFRGVGLGILHVAPPQVFFVNPGDHSQQAKWPNNTNEIDRARRPSSEGIRDECTVQILLSLWKKLPISLSMGTQVPQHQFQNRNAASVINSRGSGRNRLSE